MDIRMPLRSKVYHERREPLQLAAECQVPLRLR